MQSFVHKQFRKITPSSAFGTFSRRREKDQNGLQQLRANIHRPSRAVDQRQGLILLADTSTDEVTP